MATEERNGTHGLDPEFEAAIQSVNDAPENVAAWEYLEHLAETQQRQEDAAKTYLDAISAKPPAGIREALFEGALRYYDEWFGDDAQAMNQVLSKIIDVDPKAQWAFDRLVVILSAAEQWDALLTAHDRALERIRDPKRRTKLLDEAAHVARDFAGDPDRAATYMLEHLDLDLSNHQLAASTQRLLERQEKWQELIDLWRKRATAVSTKEARALRIQVARCCLDNLNDPDQALAELSALLDETPGDMAVCQELERLLSAESTTPAVKLTTLGKLTANYDAAKHPELAVAAIERAIGDMPDPKKRDLYREAGMRFATLGQDADAMRCYAELLAIEPTDLEARKQLRHLAVRSKQQRPRAEALVRAADVCEESAQQVALLMEAANLYWDALEDPNTAIDLFSRVLATPDVDQAVALSAAHNLNELHKAQNRGQERLEVLEQLAVLERTAEVQRAVLGEAARLATALDNPDRALGHWATRLETDRSDIEALNASVDLLEQLERWDALVDILKQRAALNAKVALHRMDLVRIATIQADRLGDTTAAIETWFSILEAFGPDRDVLEQLDQLLAAAGQWERLAQVFETAVGDDHLLSASHLSRLGHIHQHELKNADPAVDFYARSLKLNPSDATARSGLTALCTADGVAKQATEALATAYTATEDWQLLIDLLEPRLDVAPDNWSRANILAQTAELQERESKNLLGALASITRAFGLAPENEQLEREIERLALEADKWSIAAIAYAEGARAIPHLPSRSAHLHLRSASIYADRLDDIPGAIAAVGRVLEGDPNHLPALWRLADLERMVKAPSLATTLCRIDALVDQDLDPLREACDLSLASDQSYEAKRSPVIRLFQKAARLWERGGALTGEAAHPLCAKWAIDTLRSMDADAGRPDRTVPLLLSAARLPFDPEVVRDLRLVAAEILAGKGNRAQAIDVYRDVLSDRPGDVHVIQQLITLTKREGRVLEHLALLKQELELTETVDERLPLRLEIARLVSAIQGENERFHTLRANLEETPGHASSIAALSTLLDERVSYSDAIDLLTDQAQKLEEQGDKSGAAALWNMVASLSEVQFNDTERASHAYTRVVALDCTNGALDALSRLAVARGALPEAITWLKRRLIDTQEAEDRISVMLKLAKVQLRASERERAIDTLTTAFEDAPRNPEVRRLLILQYRTGKQWEPLANTLSTAAMHIEDPATIAAYAREAKEIYHSRLDRPDLAVAVLRRALEYDPTNRDMRSALAEGLRVIGELDEAQSIADGLLEDFGRRRSLERASVHLLRARIARGRGDTQAAVDELLTASAMDSQNIELWQLLATLARETGELDKAERAFRTLLLILRRGTPEDRADAGMGPSEVFMELSQIAAESGRGDQAEELCESAFEVLSTNQVEAKRFTEKLLEWQRPDLVERAIEARLAQTTKPNKRGAILNELADFLAGPLDRPEDAFKKRIEALDEDPGSPVIHDAAYAAASETDDVDAYLDKVTSLLSGMRRGADAHTRCELLLRLCTGMERDKKDLDAARTHYLAAEETGVREVDVWKVGVRIAAALNDTDEQTRLLTCLSSLGEEDVASETRADVYYRLAEIQLAAADTLEEGMGSMEIALAENPRYARAGRILCRACEAHPNEESLLALYESVAQKSGDPKVMLDAYERRASCADTTPDQIREGIDIALELEEMERAEVLMERAVELSADLIDGMAYVPWALLGLARVRMAAQDLSGAVKWAAEAAHVADPKDVFDLVRELTDPQAVSEEDLLVATELYQQLFDRDPCVREVWEPLAEMYARLEDYDHLDFLFKKARDNVKDGSDQRALGLKQAELFLAIPGREAEAVEVLRHILAEDPTNQIALMVLVNHLENAKKYGELRDLLDSQLAAALDRGDSDGIRSAALALGDHLGRHQPDQAADVFRTALDHMPDDKELLENLLANLKTDDHREERVHILERMIGVYPNDQLAPLVMEAADIFESMGDEAGQLRILDVGFFKVPTNGDIRERLTKIFRDQGNHTGLCEMLVRAADTQTDENAKITMLREAAAIAKDQLADPNAAATLFSRIIDLDPGNLEHALDLARTQATANDQEAAIKTLDPLLTEDVDQDIRVSALKMRAAIYREIGDTEKVLSDLETAFSLDPTSVSSDFEATLRELRDAAAANGDADGERKAALRLADVLIVQEDGEGARQILDAWVGKDPHDRDMLNRLIALHKTLDNWHEVAKICLTLVEIEQGDKQAEAATELAAACQKGDVPETALSTLERAFETQPENTQMRDALYAMYDHSGAYTKLAALLLEDAQVCEDDEEKAELLCRAGTLFLTVDDIVTAESVLGQALALRPGDIPTIIALVDVHLECDEVDAAEALLEKGLATCKDQKDPHLATLQQRRARVARRKEDTETELKWLKTAALNDRSNGWIVMELVERAEALEEWEMAIWGLKTIALMKTESPLTKAQVFLRQAKIFLLRGDKKRAMLFARQAYQEDPENDETTRVLDDLGLSY
ncbi:MAG: tetratricopeptide repeat protein [Myxococcota bacterium]|nr:tetratricopeptide repeat protein [Myxococcota bacterium]